MLKIVLVDFIEVVGLSEDFETEKGFLLILVLRYLASKVFTNEKSIERGKFNSLLKSIAYCVTSSNIIEENSFGAILVVPCDIGDFQVVSPFGYKL